MRDKVAFELYQIAGELLLAPDHLTPGQRDRLAELLLDVLSEPRRYSVRVVRALRRLATTP